MAEAPISKKRKRGNPNRTTGLIGVFKFRKKYKASVRYGGKPKSLGSFDTKKQAGIAYDQFVVDKSTEEVSFILNYPRMTDREREEALKVEEPVQQKRGTPNQTTGLIGVCKSGKKYRTLIMYGGTQYYLGTFDTKEQAGMAYDRFVVDKSTKEVSYTLNYPKMSDLEREEAMNIEPPPKKKRKRGNPNQKTGLIGVVKMRKKYQASITYGGTKHHLGTFDTKEQAGMAYDRAAIIINKSTEEVSFTLNYPKMSDREREVALAAEPPHKKHKRGTTRSEEESDDGSSSSSSSSDSCHSSDDDESDDEKAVEPTPSPQAPPIFERDPMLDQLFADAQHKKQQQREY